MIEENPATAGLTMPKLGTGWRHLTTQVIYEITGECRIEASNKRGVLYRRWMEPNSIVWARPLDEFLDGRFVEVVH